MATTATPGRRTGAPTTSTSGGWGSSSLELGIWDCGDQNDHRDGSVCGKRLPSSSCGEVEPTGEPGKYLIGAGQAMMDITCEKVVVEACRMSKTYDKLPITSGTVMS